MGHTLAVGERPLVILEKPQMASLELGNSIEERLASLSERERAVLDLAIRGYKDRAISTKLGIAKGTVGTYWNRIRRKVGPMTRAEIAAVIGRAEGRESNSELANALTRLTEISERLEAESARRRAAERYLQVLRRLARGAARYNPTGKRTELLIGTPDLFAPIESDVVEFANTARAVDSDGTPRDFKAFRLFSIAAGDILVALLA
jgi:DNA-binding CsgD family transcriptional regulator